MQNNYSSNYLQNQTNNLKLARFFHDFVCMCIFLPILKIILSQHLVTFSSFRIPFQFTSVCKLLSPFLPVIFCICVSVWGCANKVLTGDFRTRGLNRKNLTLARTPFWFQINRLKASYFLRLKRYLQHVYSFIDAHS